MMIQKMLFLVFMGGSQLLAAQGSTSRVTLTIDMSSEIVDSAGIFVVGNFFNGTPEPLDDNGDGTWSYTASFTKGDSLFYLFSNGVVLEDIKETVCIAETDQRRWLSVPTDEDVFTTPITCFNHCIACDEITTNTNDILLKRLQFRLFPNPMQTATLACWKNEKEVIKHIEIFDSSGRKIRSYTNLQQSQLTIEKGFLTSGLYHLRITDHEGRMVSQKLLIL